MMNQLELFHATVRHEPHPGFLYRANFTPAITLKLCEHLKIQSAWEIPGKLGLYSPVPVQPASLDNNTPEALEERYGHYYHNMDRPDGSYISGNGVLHVPGSLYHFTHYISPLKNARKLDDLEAFYYPGEGGYDETGMKEAVLSAHDAGSVSVCPIVHLYEDAWQIRGYEEFLSDLMLEPEWCEYIFNRLHQRNMIRALAAARAGVDFLHTGDDVANQNSLMFSPEIWRRFIKPRWVELYTAVKAVRPDIRIWYHSDGNIMQILPELIEIGVDILNPVQPECMNIYEIKRLYGHRLVLDGTVGTQSTLPFGTPEDVRRVIRDRKEWLGGDGALILSPTHTLEPDVPVENILAFADECRRM